jgi:predicted  nucleic acid-binding Zn-ribbon protein
VAAVATVGAFFRYAIPAWLKYRLDSRMMTRKEADERYLNLMGEIQMLKDSRGELAMQNTEQGNRITDLGNQIEGWFNKTSKLRTDLDQVSRELAECQAHRTSDRRKVSIPVEPERRSLDLFQSLREDARGARGASARLA